MPRPVTRRHFLAQAAAASGALAQRSQRSLNILFIAVDDLRPELGCYGNTLIKTPHIDRLAERSVRFDRAYCQYPLCNPSRASLLTGRYPTTTRVMDNLRNVRSTLPDAVTLPQLFRANGYASARTGKIFHGSIDDPASWAEGAEQPQIRQPRNPQEQAEYAQRSDRWVAVEDPGRDQPDYRTASRAIELLEKYKNQRFFLAVGFVKPHSALIAPKSFFDLYDASKVPLPRDFAPRPTVGPGVPAVALPPRSGDLFIGRDAEPPAAREMIRAYYACTSFVDAQLGRVLGKLDQLGLRDSTVVLFWGDHGYHLGEKGKWSKHGSLYEVAARVPLLVSAPGFRGNGRACPRTVELLDMYPTLAELCGLPPPEGLEGQSLVPLLNDPQAKWDHPAYTVVQRGQVFGRSIRTERYRYTEWGPDGTQSELYDHTADPHEMRNLAGDSKLAATVKELREALRRLPVRTAASNRTAIAG